MRALRVRYLAPLPWQAAPARIYAGAMNEALRPAPLDSTQAAAARQLSIVVPTFNERENVVTLYERLKATLGETPWEVVFVDDNSPDETW